MRKYRYLALAAGAAMLLGAPTGAALAASVSSAKPVLTINKVGGPAVKKGAVLKASLYRTSKVTFTIGTTKATCSSSSIAAKVLKNPAKAGVATLSVTKATDGKCSPVATFSLSVSAVHLPWNGTIKATKGGGSVTITGTKASLPVGFEAVVKSGTSTIATCIFTGAKFSGTASNKHQTVAFKNQKLTLAKGSTSLCSSVGTSATVTATYGPIVDSSVKHSPKVFIS